MTEKSPLDDHAFLNALLDIAIPPGASRNLPGGGSLALAAEVAAGLRADLMLGPMVEPGLQALRDAAQAEHPGGLAGMAPDEGAAFVEAQLRSFPFLMPGVLRYVYPAYYQRPRVLEAIGEPPRPPFPEGFDVEPTDPALLEKLLARRRE